LSGRLSFAIAVVILLGAMVFRFWEVTLLPPGLNADELTDVRLMESARDGRVTVFADMGNGEGREGLYHAVLAAVTTFTGKGLLGLHVFSAWAGMLALSMVYALGTRLFGRLAGLSALALMSFTFWPVLLSREVSREMLLPLVVSAALLCLAVSLPVYRRKRRRGANTTLFAALGVTLGLALYVHPVGLLVVLICVVFIAYMILFARQKISRRRGRYITFALLMLMIMAMPYVTSSIQLGSLNGAQRLFEHIPGISIKNTLNGLMGVSLRGDANPVNNIPGRPLLDPITSIIALTGGVIAFRNWRKPTHALVLVAGVILAPIAFLAQNGPDFHSYAAILPIIALMFGLGLDFISDLLVRYVPRVSRPLTALGFTALIAFNIAWTGQDLFTRWPALISVQQAYDTRIAYLSSYLDQTATQIQTVICSQGVPDELDANTQLLLAMMNRPDPPLRYVDCSSGFVMTHGGERQQVILPGESDLTNAHWRIREWLLRGEWIEGQQIPRQSVLTMNVEERLADVIGRFTLIPVTYAPETASPGRPTETNIPVYFGGNIAFLGYAPDITSAYTPGSVVTVVSYWRVDGVVPPDLLIFTHIQADPAAVPIAQTDTISVLPRQLENRDVIVQVTYIPLPQNMPPGEYQISIGVYQDTSDQRLDVLEDGMPRGDRLFLYGITVNN